MTVDAAPSDPPAAGPERLAALVAALPGGGEDRPGQARMAEAVAAAIAGRRHLVVQAGTGTGKSLAYLVPAIASGQKVVVATATKALQDQLARKDLPFVASQMPVRFAVLKGRSNYLCRQRAAEVADDRAQGRLADGDDDRAEVERLVAWAEDHPTGDRAELEWEPSGRAWAQLSVSARECPGATRCPSGDQCFAEAARRRAAAADVVVVNSHLYGLNLASGGAILPEHDVVVLDEAHELEDVFSSTLGLELGPTRFTAAARSVGSAVDDRATVEALDGAGTRLTAVLAGRAGERVAPGDEAVGAVLELAAGRVEQARATLARLPTDGPAELVAKVRRARMAVDALADDLGRLAATGDDMVVWVEGPDHNPTLRAAPVAVGPALAGLGAWDDRVAILTSATVAPAVAGRLGLPADRTDRLEAGSPFDHRRQGLLYVARHLPDPRDEGWAAAARDELAALVAAAGGRTLALFTSWRTMSAAAEELRTRLDVPVLAQGDLPKPALIEAFAADEATCLFATMSFWQGVDVPGRTLSLVVIDRLPFARPGDPLWDARRQRAGDAAFATVDIPRAATLLAQGAGRLMRSAHDRGVVAVLDRRLAIAGYRRELLALVPPLKRTVTRSEVEAFLATCR